MIGEPVTVLRPGGPAGTDRYGNPIPGSDIEIQIDGAAFDPGGSREPVEVGRAPVTTTPKLYFPGTGVEVRATDRVRVRGDVYTVVGRPAVWVNPWTGGTAGTVVELALVEG